MELIISNSSSTPLYEQIIEQMKMKILNHELKRDEALPSIRALAKDLKVSIITTKRAYEELEAEGFVKTIQGKGTYVSGVDTGRLREARISQIEQQLNGIVEAAKGIDMTVEDMIERITILYEEE